MSFLTAPEWTSTNDSEEQMNFSCQSSGFAGILPFATHPPLSRFRVNGSHSAPLGGGKAPLSARGRFSAPSHLSRVVYDPARWRPGPEFTARVCQERLSERVRFLRLRPGAILKDSTHPCPCHWSLPKACENWRVVIKQGPSDRIRPSFAVEAARHAEMFLCVLCFENRHFASPSPQPRRGRLWGFGGEGEQGG